MKKKDDNLSGTSRKEKLQQALDQYFEQDNWAFAPMCEMISDMYEDYEMQNVDETEVIFDKLEDLLADYVKKGLVADTKVSYRGIELDVSGAICDMASEVACEYHHHGFIEGLKIGLKLMSEAGN